MSEGKSNLIFNGRYSAYKIYKGLDFYWFFSPKKFKILYISRDLWLGKALPHSLLTECVEALISWMRVASLAPLQPRTWGLAPAHRAPWDAYTVHFTWLKFLLFPVTTKEANAKGG